MTHVRIGRPRSKKHGVDESKASIASKLSRACRAIFFLPLVAMGRKNVSLNKI